MKYEKQLKTNSFPAWKEKYLAYGKLKRMLKRYAFQRSMRKKGDDDEELKFAREEAAYASEAATPNASEKTPLKPFVIDPLPEERGSGLLSVGDARRTAGIAAAIAKASEDMVKKYIEEGRGGYRWVSDSSEESGALPGVSSPKMAQAMGEHAEYIRLRRLESADAGESNGREFFDLVNEELRKVDTFFKGKGAELDNTLRGFEERGHYMHSWGVPSGNKLSPLFEAYIEVMALGAFARMNSEGFRKIVKKYDKVMETQTLSRFMQGLETFDFYKSRMPGSLSERVQGLVSRDKLLDMKRRAESLHSDRADKELFPAIKFPHLAISFLLFFFTWIFRPELGGNVHASRCLAMLVLVTSLWMSEAIPYFVTGVLIPVLVVLMDVMAEPDGDGMTRTYAANTVLSNMVNHTTVLILGGYSISAAFSRCEIELRIASLLQQQFGDRPRLFILGIMYLGLFLSTLISNHTAPVLCVSILMPIIQDLDVSSRFAKTLLLGLAFACNFGGMVTPISSMQNVVAQQAIENAGMSIGFGMWIAVSLPFCLVGVFVAWCLLCVIMNPTDVKEIPVIVYSKTDVLSRKNMFIVGITLLTIFGWSSIGYTENFWGDLGIIALVFIVVAFGSGILTEVDFNSFSWHTLFLLGGGNVLGKAIKSSKLLEILANAVIDFLPKDDRLLLTLSVTSATMLISTFVSHTVASLILMPIIVEVGMTCDNPLLLGMAAALAVSSGCALPFSSFPNVSSLLVSDDFGRKYLSVRDFLTSGIPMSIVSVAMICTLGYGLINMVLLPSVDSEWGEDDNSRPLNL